MSGARFTLVGGVKLVIYKTGGACLEVAPFGKAGGAARRASVAGSGVCVVAGHLQKVRADRVESMVCGQKLISIQGRQQVERVEMAREYVHGAWSPWRAEQGRIICELYDACDAVSDAT